MARTTATPARGARKSSRWTTFGWIAAATVIIVALILTEQVALLYVLATLSVTALLMIVAMADLGGTRQPLTEPAPNDDSAAVGDNLSASPRGSRETARRR
jgi:hypothetical protein